MNVFGLFEISTYWLAAPILVILTLQYMYLTWEFGYLEKQNVPVIKPFPLVGSFRFDILNTPFHEIDHKYAKKLGRLYGGYFGRKPYLVVGEPELLRSILVKDFYAFTNRTYFEFSNSDVLVKRFLSNLRDDEWKQLRTIMSPSFTSGKLKKMTYLIEESVQVLVTELDKAVDSEKAFDIRTWFWTLGIDVVASCAFGTKMNSIQEPDNLFVDHAKRVFGSVPPLFLIMFVLCPRLVKYLPIGFLPKDAMKFFTRMITEVIDSRAQGTQNHHDFLQLLLDGQVKNNENDLLAQSGKSKDTENTSTSTTSKKNLDLNTIMSQCILFLLAGHETTTSLITFSSYCLAINPDVQEKLIREIDKMVESDDGKITYESVMKLPYLDMVISETLRMYPPSPRIDRQCEAEGYEIGGVKIPKNMMIIVSIYSIHHDPEFYPNPEVFDPERFSPEMKAARDPFTYLPFGSGPRNCIGMRFALLEAKMALTHILRHFRFCSCPETKIPLEFKSGFLMTAKEINIRIQRRSSLQ